MLEAIPSPAALRALLGSVGAVTEMEQIGMDPKYKDATLRYSPYVRRRLTVMRLKKLLRPR